MKRRPNFVSKGEFLGTLQWSIDSQADIEHKAVSASPEHGVGQFVPMGHAWANDMEQLICASEEIFNKKRINIRQ